jgi:hypothetical protein
VRCTRLTAPPGLPVRSYVVAWTADDAPDRPDDPDDPDDPDERTVPK